MRGDQPPRVRAGETKLSRVRVEEMFKRETYTWKPALAGEIWKPALAGESCEPALAGESCEPALVGESCEPALVGESPGEEARAEPAEG